MKQSVVNLMARPALGLEQALRTGRTLRHAAWAASSFSLVLLLVELAILMLGAGAGAASAPGGPDVGQVALLAGFQLVMATLGALIVQRHPRNPIGWIFIVVALLFGVAGAAGSYGSIAGASLPGAGIAAWAATIASGPVLFGALAFLFLLFPSGRLLSSRWRWAALGTAAALVLVALSEATLPGPLQSYASVSNPFGIEPLGPILQAVFGGAALLLLLMVAVAAVSLVVRFRHSQGQEREQLKWVASATAAVATLFLSGPIFWFVLPPALGQWWPLVFFLALALVPLAVGVAMLRYRLYDIGLIVNRALVYGILTVGIVGLYMLIVGGLGGILQARASDLLPLLATGVVAVLFQPLRERLQRAANRLMYGQRDEPYAVVSQLGRQLEATLAPDEILPVIVETVASSLRLPYVAIELTEDAGSMTSASFGRPREECLTLPLLYQGERLGRLILGRRPGEADFSAADRRLIDDLARQAGVAAFAFRLTADLQRSRERLVTAREEERRRLRRDLHDGLGPALATMAMQSDAARDALGSDPTQADALLSDLTEQLQDATADIRRLVHDLRPPALDDLGLIGAVRNHIVQFERGGLRVTLDAPASLPPLPAATEVAAYRITLEALNNVHRHADARICRVALALDERSGLLDIEITDDGRGIPGGRRAGVGLASMRERAAELGGVCVIERLEAGGTRIHASLPAGSAGGRPAATSDPVAQA